MVKQGSRTIPLHIFADGDHVIVEARGAMTTMAGETCDNEYCLIYRFSGGRIVEMREYCDSVLCEARLGLYQAGKGAISYSIAYECFPSAIWMLSVPLRPVSSSVPESGTTLTLKCGAPRFMVPLC